MTQIDVSKGHTVWPLAALLFHFHLCFYFYFCFTLQSLCHLLFIFFFFTDAFFTKPVFSSVVMLYALVWPCLIRTSWSIIQSAIHLRVYCDNCLYVSSDLIFIYCTKKAKAQHKASSVQCSWPKLEFNFKKHFIWCLAEGCIILFFFLPWQ